MTIGKLWILILERPLLFTSRYEKISKMDSCDWVRLSIFVSVLCVHVCGICMGFTGPWMPGRRTKSKECVFCLFSTMFLWDSLFLNLELTKCLDGVTCQLQGSSSLCYTMLVWQACTSMLTFYVGAEDLNSGPQACRKTLNQLSWLPGIFYIFL